MVFRLIRMRIPPVVPRSGHAPSLLLVWALFILYATMLPFDFSANGDLIRWRLHRLWERPLRGGGGSWHDVYSNVLLFVPWGVLLGICLVGRRSAWLTALVWALVSGACLSGFVEFLQVFAPLRHMSFIDLAANTLGSVMGALIGWPLARWIWPVSSVRIRQLQLAHPLAACALVVVVGLLVAGLAPTYVKYERQGTAAKLKSMRPIQFGVLPGEHLTAAAMKVGCRDSDLDADRWTFCAGRSRIRPWRQPGDRLGRGSLWQPESCHRDHAARRARARCRRNFGRSGGRRFCLRRNDGDAVVKPGTSPLDHAGAGNLGCSYGAVGVESIPVRLAPSTVLDNSHVRPLLVVFRQPQY